MENLREIMKMINSYMEDVKIQVCEKKRENIVMNIGLPQDV